MTENIYLFWFICFISVVPHYQEVIHDGILNNCEFQDPSSNSTSYLACEAEISTSREKYLNLSGFALGVSPANTSCGEVLEADIENDGNASEVKLV